MLADSLYEADDEFNPFADAVSPLNPQSANVQTSAEPAREISSNAPDANSNIREVSSPGKSVNVKSLPLETLTLDSAPLGPLDHSTPSTVNSENNPSGSSVHESFAIPSKPSLLPKNSFGYSGVHPHGLHVSEVNPYSSEPSSITQEELRHKEASDASPKTMLAEAGPHPSAPTIAPSMTQKHEDSQVVAELEVPSVPPLNIQVHDPHTVSELAKSHTVYLVSSQLESDSVQSTEVTVQRRYRDFDCLYQLLSNNYPGCIIPPPPEKQVVGRLDDEVVEHRRAALEVMLRKISSHPLLRNDSFFEKFLRVDNFDTKLTNYVTPIDAASSSTASGSSGLLDSFTSAFHTSSSSKYIEQDPLLAETKLSLDALETQLRSMYHALLLCIDQRLQLLSSIHDFGESLANLSLVDLDPSLSSQLDNLSQIQIELQFSQERKVAQDNLTLGVTIEEYIRNIESAKNAYSTRQKLWQVWQSSLQSLSRLDAQLDKCRKQSKFQQKSLPYLESQVEKYRVKSSQLAQQFENSTALLKHDLKQFSNIRVDDLKASVETWLESAIESQKELIDRWESFLE
ncbi:retromer complex subunit Vps5 [Schizosaccharomyces cryophilus OY26]|uniref:Retromer complex subunit Vps5 n=1 Tax=Schizosaccharomyces cryophilus (strain OY26 / ATCC MYA-4695 / CBS 11777 / NBRC 106824 / NRRL Y48691) TaxID=653667 RepID=S9VUM5_SCHCR|nr:retromer complex subunit Vps5 [Schizosaccharomyces cryophilus OY26]EPY49859.1 retromer complex subunit Vps5 [Schizosaccharomyces cryophilus OY26]